MANDPVTRREFYSATGGAFLLIGLLGLAAAGRERIPFGRAVDRRRRGCDQRGRILPQIAAITNRRRFARAA